MEVEVAYTPVRFEEVEVTVRDDAGRMLHTETRDAGLVWPWFWGGVMTTAEVA
jgi:hypothetical protein